MKSSARNAGRSWIGEKTKMTKAMEKHIVNIWCQERSFAAHMLDGKLIGVTDGCRVLVLPGDTEITSIFLQKKNAKILEDILKFDEDYKLDYKMRELPTLKEIKGGIKEVAGRNYRTRVCWSPDGELALNAKWLAAAMEVLHTREMYTCTSKRHPVILYDRDDPNTTKEYIWPVNNKNGNTGFFIPKEG